MMGKWLTDAGRRAIRKEIRRINSSFATAQRIGAVKALNWVLSEGAVKSEIAKRSLFSALKTKLKIGA